LLADGRFLLNLPFLHDRAMILPPPNHPSSAKRAKPKALAKALAKARAKAESKSSSQSKGKSKSPSTSLPPAKPQIDSKALTHTEQLASAMQLLHKIVQTSGQQILVDPDARPTTKMVYTNGVTLWMLILQRLGGGKTLEEVVSQVLTHDRHLLPDNKRVRENTLSENSAAYARGRQRLPLDTIQQFSECVCNYLGQISEPILGSRRLFILDGTTITLPPTPALRAAYPPAPNQYGESVWPVAMLMVANEMQSGCALLPQVDAMYGEHNASEAEQGRRIVKQLPAHSIVMADSGFGIYSVAYHSTQSQHDFLFRLTKSRFRRLQRQAELIDEGPTHKTYHLHWQPSAKDRKTNPDLPAEVSIEVLVHEVEISPQLTLYLITDLEIDGLSAASLYQRRYDVEFDIRDLKVTLDTENIRAKSVEMFKKELYTSVIAYNLVAQFRRQAAELAKIKPRRLSFKGVWTTLKDRLLLQPACSLEQWLERYAEALYRASQKRHPQRKSPRTYPRKAHPRRPKSTKFEKSQRRKKKPDAEQPPAVEPT
jgi:hypothetical protein